MDYTPTPPQDVDPFTGEDAEPQNPTPELMPLLEQRAALADELDALEDTVKKLKVDAKAMDERLLEQFQMGGLKNVNAHGRTFYLHSSIRTKQKKGGAALAEACQAHGWQDFCTANANQIKSEIVSLQKQGQPIPDWLDEVLEISTEPSVRVKKGR